MLFSVPLNPKLSEPQFNEFIQFLTDYRDWIYDIYFTCRIPPFIQDAMGDVIPNQEDVVFAIETALYVQQETGISISATFNNIDVRPSQENLDLFIDNFRPVYDAGVRSATIPHTHWLATGQIKKEFPELMVKNTILRNVTEPRDIVKLAEAGFDYINIDRDLMRDYDKLLRIKKAKEVAGVKIALLANEGCAGGCIMMDEHYQLNNTRMLGMPQYFNSAISRVSCPKWDAQDPAIYLKTANLTPWREDWEDLRENYGIDVFKMHGRESTSRLWETMQIIKKYAAGEKILFDQFDPFIEETNLKDKPIDIWRKKIQTCKFDCWDCHFCDKIYDAKYGKKPNKYADLVAKELVDSVNYDLKLDIPGLTSNRVQKLLNRLAAHCNNYLEIGSYLGATACAVLKDNNISCHFVDNWKEEVYPMNHEKTPENDKNVFMENIKKYAKSNKIFVHKKDMFQVDTTTINQIDLFFYDGPHDHESTYGIIQYYKNCFSDTAILIFDDANWEGVVSGAQEGIIESGLNVIYSKLMLNDIEDERNWWNGLYIVVVTK